MFGENAFLATHQTTLAKRIVSFPNHKRNGHISGTSTLRMQVMARITGLVGVFLGNSRRSEWFTSVVVGLWTNAWP